ncbi:hypothetical protein IGI04_021760 [Brassica rapa subsp. trilocularis]|uniref:Uncharacterized protein n=1 Tax=Brassica rapa subsp. trilocularis TaxID=1813537 RepID=A0ABQ7LZQ3_BRACM|nr:hypothetical protein IGI04_021760 [Brassica rapa subsp. trilocularis]
MIKARVWCQIVFWSARLWKKYAVLFQKMERIAVGGTYESQDPSERKLQRSMTVRSAGDVSGYGSSRFLETKVQDRKDEDASVYETITGHNIQRMVEALSVWWYMNCFEEAMTPGGFSVRSEGFLFQVESCLYKCCSAHLQMFFGFRWSSATGSDEFLKSSQCIEGKENQVECVQENVKCSDIKAESEREKQFLGGAIFSKESCIIRVLSSRLRNKFLLKFSQSVSLQEAVQVQVSRLSWLDRRLVESGLIQGGNKYVSGFCKRFSVVFLILISEILYIESLLNRVVLSGVFCWRQQRCRVVFKSVCSSSGCEENLRLSSWCLLFVEIGFKGFESRSFWFEASDSCSASDSITDGWSSQVSGFIETAKRESMKKLSLTQSCVKAVYQLKKTVLRNEKVINITAMACEFHVWFIDGD